MKHFDEIFENEYDVVILPGGLDNSKQLGTYENLIQVLRDRKQDGKWIAAICASPSIVLADNDLLEGEDATCFPGLGLKGANPKEDDVVISNKFITSRSPGTAMAFAFALVEIFFSK